jgi:hypothetical protein
MANAFIFPNEIIETGIKLLEPQLVLSRLVWRDAFGDWSGRLNDTVSIRVLDPVESHQNTMRATGSGRNLIVSDLTEQTIDVKIDRHPYNLVHLTDEEETLDIENFASQVLARQINSLSRRLERNVSELIINAPYDATHVGGADSLYEAIVHADTSLNEEEIPMEDRFLVVGSRFEEALRLDERLIRTDSQGSFAEDALQRARLGMIAGYNILVSHFLPKSAAYLFHRTAFAVVSRPPRAPYAGAPAVGATASTDGAYALRWIGDWDMDAQTDRSLIDTFYGDAVIEDPDKGLIRAQQLVLEPTALTTPATATVTAAAGVDHSEQIVATGNYGDTLSGAASWSSSDPTKATVDHNGVVTGVAAGTTTITATIGAASDTTTVTVS